MTFLPKKCSLIVREVKYIGHIVSLEGVQAEPDKIYKVKKLAHTDKPYTS